VGNGCHAGGDGRANVVVRRRRAAPGGDRLRSRCKALPAGTTRLRRLSCSVSRADPCCDARQPDRSRNARRIARRASSSMEPTEYPRDVGLETRSALQRCCSETGRVPMHEPRRRRFGSKPPARRRSRSAPACRGRRVESVELTKRPRVRHGRWTRGLEGRRARDDYRRRCVRRHVVRDRRCGRAGVSRIEPHEGRANLSRVGGAHPRCWRVSQLSCVHPENPEIAGRQHRPRSPETLAGASARWTKERRRRCARPASNRSATGTGPVPPRSGGPTNRARNLNARRRHDDARIRDRLDVRRPASSPRRLSGDRAAIRASDSRQALSSPATTELYVDQGRSVFPEGYPASRTTWPGDRTRRR